jgi:hypothetical protein
MKHGHCLWCSRPADACWVLPCLELQRAVEDEDDAAMIAWARHAGLGLERKGKTLVSPLERCLVCGHYHGGQGACVTSHAFVAPKDCPKCVKEGRT